MYRRCVIKPGEIAPALHLLLLKNGLAKLWSHGSHRTEAALSAQLLRINTNRGHLSSALVMSRHVSSFDFFVHICMTSSLRWTFCLPSCVTCSHCHSLPIWQKLRYQIDWSVMSKVRHCAPSFKSSKRLQSFKSKLPAKRARTPATIRLLGFEKYSCLYTAVHPRWNRCFLGKSASTAIHKSIIGIFASLVGRSSDSPVQLLCNFNFCIAWFRNLKTSNAAPNGGIFQVHCGYVFKSSCLHLRSWHQNQVAA